MSAHMPIRPFTTPIRIPSAVEPQIADPRVARAGEIGRWKLTFLVAEDVPESTELSILFHGGRNVTGAWAGLQVDEPGRVGFVSVRRESGEDAGTLRMPNAGAVLFDAPPGGLKAGEQLEVALGGDESGARAPDLSLPSKMFLLILPLPAEASDVPAINLEPAKKIIGACLIHVTGAEQHHLRAYAPSQVQAGQPFSISVRPEDRFGNVANERPEALRVLVDGGEMAGWERTDGEFSACCRLEGLVLDQAGVCRLRIETAGGGLATDTNPIVCVEAGENAGPATFWGMIHGHTENSDGAGSLDHYYTYMRDDCGLDFGAAGDHDHVFETSEDMWRMTQDAAVRYNDPPSFVSFLGYEWAKWRRNGDGDRNVYYLHDHRPMYRSDNGHCATPPELFAALRDETAMVIPHHPAEIGNHCDWKAHNPEKERLVEIYSVWGNSERSVNDGNPFPVRPASGGNTDKGRAAGEVPDGFVQRALALGWRVGFTAGGDDHTGHPGDDTRRGHSPWHYSAGLLAVRAAENSREAIWDALWQRRCYGTTGARIIIDFCLNDEPMGSELRLGDFPELRSCRSLRVAVHGCATVSRIEIVRNNSTVFVHQGTGPDEDVGWDDTDAFESVALPPAEFCAVPFCFYYVRVSQSDGEMAWVSPIWVSK